MITLKDSSSYIFESGWLKIRKTNIGFDFHVKVWYIWFKVASITQEGYEKIATQLFTSQFETKNNKENSEETVQL